MKKILNITGYKFIKISDKQLLKEKLLENVIF